MGIWKKAVELAIKRRYIISNHVKLGLMLSLMVDATYGRDVPTDDTTGSFLQTDYSKGDIYINM